MNDMKTQSIGFLIFDGFPMACLTSMIEPLRAANEISGQDAFSWTLMAETMDKICSSAGVNFEPDMVLGQAEGPDYLFLLSPPMAGFSNPKVGYGALRALSRHGTIQEESQRPIISSASPPDSVSWWLPLHFILPLESD